MCILDKLILYHSLPRLYRVGAEVSNINVGSFTVHW